MCLYIFGYIWDFCLNGNLVLGCRAETLGQPSRDPRAAEPRPYDFDTKCSAAEHSYGSPAETLGSRAETLRQPIRDIEAAEQQP